MVPVTCHPRLAPLPTVIAALVFVPPLSAENAEPTPPRPAGRARGQIDVPDVSACMH